VVEDLSVGERLISKIIDMLLFQLMEKDVIEDNENLLTALGEFKANLWCEDVFSI